jgi:group I intron endonuclease
MIGGVYQIRNTVTDDVYVGSTSSFDRRKQEHFKQLRAGKHPCRHLQNSASKHGVDVFRFEVLKECFVEELLIHEQAEIDRVLAEGRDRLYNANTLADRHVWAEESKQLLREKRVGARNPFFGKKHTAETGARMSASRLGRPAWNKGRRATPEHRAAIAASGVGRKQSAETRAKRSKTMQRLAAEGKLFGEGHRAAMSTAQRARRARSTNRTDL